jgi:signal transduction histidine kinase
LSIAADVPVPSQAFPRREESMTAPSTMPASLEGLRTALWTLQKHLRKDDPLYPIVQTSLEQLQLFTSEANRADEHARLAAIYQVSRAIGASLFLDDALTQVMDAVIQLTGAERGAVMLFDESIGGLDLRAARNLERESLSDKEMEFSRTVVETTARTGKAVLTTNAQTDPRFSEQRSVMQYALRSILCVPLKVKERVLGVIYADNRVRSGVFATRDLELLEAFAVQAAIAIENAQLYTFTDRALAARAAELEGLQRVDRQLNATLDTPIVAGTLLDWALRITHAARGWVAVRSDSCEDPEIIARSGYDGSVPCGLPAQNDPLAGALSGGEVRCRPAGGLLAAAMLAPVVHEGVTRGLVMVERPAQDFSDAERGALARLADHAAAAVENTRLYQAVRRANESKTEFVRFVSHELKTPMTSIRGYADLLQHGLAGAVNEKQLDFLHTIMNNVDRMATLVSDLADISRIEAGRLRIEPADASVATSIQEVVESMRPQFEARRQRVEVSLPEDLPKVRTDLQRLNQILSNLLSNANKYTPDDGSIRVSAAREGGFIRITVRDTGIGMSEEEQAKLFTQFFRGASNAVRDQAGWGLGLHVTKRLVEVLGGSIGAESKLEEGSTFYFTQPVAGG